MWVGIANDLSVPWRTLEAMHWFLGEQEMARRARVVPFARDIPPSDHALAGSNLSHTNPNVAPDTFR